MAPKNTQDHWAFLEEIEAPMWVDFTLEAKSNYQDIDDKWFYATHPFHQCSSHQLKTAFSYPGEGSGSACLDLMGPSSPKLPSSVSRSRGKHYAKKKWRGDDCDLSLEKQHPVKFLNGKSSKGNPVSGDEIKPKLSFVKYKGNSKSTINANENDFKAASGLGGLGSSSSSVVDKAGESYVSTITSESDQQPQQRDLEVSSLAFGRTSGLLSAVRISLRKSCVTRQASRVEINNDNKHLRDRKSSSSKFSVGSSSYTGYDVKRSTFTLSWNKEQTTDNRNVARMTEAAKNKGKKFNVSKGTNFQVEKGVSNVRGGNRNTIAKSAHQEAAKSKVQNKILHAKALLQHRVNEQGSLAGASEVKEKARMGGFNILAGPEKENATERISVSQKCSTRDIATKGITKCGKGAKQNVPRKNETTGLVGKREKSCSNSANLTQIVHL